MTIAKGPGGPIYLDIAPRKVELDLALTNVTLPDKHQRWKKLRTLSWGAFRSLQWGRF